MKILFQLALSVCPAIVLFLALTLISIKKKSSGRVCNIVMLSVFSMAAAALLITGLVSSAQNGNLVSEKISELNMKVACAVAKEEDYTLALEMLDDMRAHAADSAETAECAGWIYAAKGEPITAKAMFAKANTIAKMDDYDSVVSLCDEAVIDTQSQEKLVKKAKKKISNMADNDDVEDVGQVLVEAQEVYQSFLTSNTLDSDRVSKLVNKIEDACEGTPELEKIEAVRVCKIKLLTLANDFDGVAESIDENSGFNELAIAAELYINGLVDDDSFSDEYGEKYAKSAEIVSKQLKKIKDKIPSEESYKRKNLDMLVETLDSVDNDPAIGRIRADLTTVANNEQSTHRPKAYMQLARLAYAEGEDDVAAQHISSALNTVGISEDENFSTPMIGIVDSITDKNDIGKVKDIAQYAQDVTNNSSDYIVVKSIEQYHYTDNTHQTPNYSDSTENSEEDTRNPFEVFFADTASQKRNAFSITSVDATDFPEVQLIVNVDPSISITADELKELIAIKDCGVEIEDFSIEKVEYSGANILLCCDTSGSMSGQPIEDLKKAVQEFVQTSTDIESIALVTFEGQVEQVYRFGTDKDEIISAAQGLYSGGGTNMYGAVTHSIDMFSPTEDELNFILLMSDGEDGYSPSNDEINNNVGAACKEKDIVLYSLGLSEGVNVEYMDTFATVTGGYFVYVNDSASLNDFYTKLRSQILNRYIITYTAKDTLRASREVTVSLKDAINDNIVSDTKQYQMNGTDADMSQTDPENNSVQFNGFSISGLDTRRVFKSSQTTTVKLLGTGFTDKMVFDVKLDGKLDYKDIECTFTDENTLELKLPGGMACGAYDLVVTVDGKTGLFPDELTISAKGAEKTTTFGNYVFTSDSRVETDNGVVLSGFVTMNGWLHFKGDVEIIGDLSEYSVQVKDLSGSYVKYYKNSATGLAGLLAQNNISVPILPLGNFNLYKDAYETGESAEHRVDKIPLPMVYISNFATLKTPSMELYPNMIKLSSDGFNTNFPMQETLLKAASVDDLFSFELDVEVGFTNKEIEMQIEYKKEADDDDKTETPMNFGNQPIKLTPEYEIKIDTIENEYMIDMGVNFSFIDKDEENERGLGLMLEWTKRDEDQCLQFLVPKTVQVKADFPIKAHIGPVPVTYRDFKLGLTDIDPNKNVLHWTLTGGFDLETTKISEYIGGIGEYIDDPPLFKFDDTEVSLSLGQCYLGAETEAKLVDAITLGKLNIDLGKFDYTCALLDMYDQSTFGIKAELKLGIIWETDNVDVDISGTGIFNLHTRFLGVELQGKCDVELSWWIFSKQYYTEGRAIIGVMNNHGRTAFVVKVREVTSKGVEDIYAYIDANGVDCGSKKL